MSQEIKQKQTTIDVLISGVGGQGTVSIGHILGEVCNEIGLVFVASETHGMSQRGGSVVFHFRIGRDKSPLIPLGNADIIIAGEPMEALRVVNYLKPNGTVISSTKTILSPVARQLGISYPDLDDIWKSIENWPASLIKIDIEKLEQVYGKFKENMVLLGLFIRLIEIEGLDYDTVLDIISRKWPQYTSLNAKSLDLGYNKLISDHNKLN